MPRDQRRGAACHPASSPTQVPGAGLEKIATQDLEWRSPTCGGAGVSGTCGPFDGESELPGPTSVPQKFEDLPNFSKPSATTPSVESLLAEAVVRDRVCRNRSLGGPLRVAARRRCFRAKILTVAPLPLQARHEIFSTPLVKKAFCVAASAHEGQARKDGSMVLSHVVSENRRSRPSFSAADPQRC